ncbi:hypothetical protein DL98DRAFT_517406 [Cadophora sp. DSE1049]|nr:hypothetical protein DL98DRAFT_517406 [Cadophora sp. DSE1049]
MYRGTAKLFECIAPSPLCPSPLLEQSVSTYLASILHNYPPVQLKQNTHQYPRPPPHPLPPSHHNAHKPHPNSN